MRAHFMAMLFGAGALAPVRAQADVATLVTQLGQDDARTRHDAYLVLLRTRPPEAIALLGERLPGYSIYSQGLGVTVLQSYPLEATRTVFDKLLKADSPFLRGTAAAAMWRSGDKAHGATLAAAIHAGNDEARAQLLNRLWGIDDNRVRDAVRAQVKASSGLATLESALLHLLQTKPGPDAASKAAAELVVVDAASTAPARAAGAAFLLAAGVDKHVALLAKQVAEDSNVVPRLRTFLDRAPRLGAQLQQALNQRLLAARSEYEVTWSAQVLQKHDAAQVTATLRELLKSKDEPVRKAALETLAQMPRGLQPNELRGMLAHDDPQTALVAADAMRRMDDTSAIGRVLELVSKPGAHRAAAVRSLGHFRLRSAVLPLLDALADPEEPVRREAWLGLQRILPGLFPYRRFDFAGLGFTPEGDATARTAAIGKLRSWWHAQ